jgi:DNA-binding transcriptional LysR family regulator
MSVTSNLTQIRLLAELSRSHSVSRAAHRIGVSQSAASHALAKLRKKLGDPLFTRIRDRFEPTPFGALNVCVVRGSKIDQRMAALGQ